MKKGFIHFSNLCDSSLELKLGAFQGSVVSPLLCNILLHELDVYLKSYCSKFSNLNSSFRRIPEKYNENRRSQNSGWISVWGRIRTTAHKNISGAKIRAALRTIIKLDAAARRVRYYQEDLSTRKIQYIRYAGAFILGLISTKEFAYKTLSCISLISDSLGMVLNVNKTQVRHHEKGTLFLGYQIYGDYKFNVK